MCVQGSCHNASAGLGTASGRRALLAVETALDTPNSNPRQRTRSLPKIVSMLIIGIWGLAALFAGLWLLPPQLALHLSGALNAVLAQLPVTLPAAILMLVAATVNIGTAGLLVHRILPAGRRPLAASVLAAYGSAVLLDVALLYVLGGLGIFNLPVLVVVHASLLAIALVGRHARPRPVVGPLLPHLGWGLVAFVWSAPVLLQLASPVVPFLDVLPNLVAPVEHLRTFAQFDPLTTSPSPIYGPSRLSIGYIGLLGTVSTLTGLPAGQASSAFIAVEVALVAIAIAVLARSARGPNAVYWALIAFAMTQPFARLADDRSRLLAIPIIAWTAIEILRASRQDTLQRQASWRIGIGLGATLLMHAVIGGFMVLVALVVVAMRPARHRSVVPALPFAAILALPQGAVMVGIAVPSLLAVTVFPGAAAASFAVAHMPGLRRALELAARIGLMLAIAVAVAGAGFVVPAFARWFFSFAPTVPILGLTGLAGLIWVRSSMRWLLIAMMGVGILGGTLANLVPADANSLLWTSVHYEVPKEVHTWLPVTLAISSAALLASIVARTPAAGWLDQGWRLGLVGAWLLISALPLRTEPIDGLHVGERHLSENLAIQLRYAETGYWIGYPDTRWVTDDAQREVLAAIRREIVAGRITATTRLLHVSRTYQQWGAIPVGVFTGVLETDVSPDSKVTIHTVGGRLVPMDGLDAELAAGYDYLLIEWRGLPPDIAQLIGGFEPVFTNQQAELLRHRAPNTQAFLNP